jgi:phenylalanyl-tRNA synthetase beta chain
LAEEVGRIYGYENIPDQFLSEGFKLPEINKVKRAIDITSDLMVQFGFFEAYNRTIVKKGVVELANSLNANATALRTNLLDKLKERAEKNLSHSDEPKLFEIGKVFVGSKSEKSDRVVDEYFSFAGIIGRRKIKEKQKEDLFFTTKGYLEKVFETLGIKNTSWKDADNKEFLADIFIDNEKIGSVGVNF